MMNAIIEKQDGCNKKVREHCDKKERHDVGPPESGVRELRRGLDRRALHYRYRNHGNTWWAGLDLVEALEDCC